MKTPLKWVLCVCVLTGTAFAQVYEYGAPGTTTRTEKDRTTTTREAGQSQKFCRSKDLVGANIKDTQGQKLGSVDEILINPQNGETFAFVDISGGRYTLVPIQALSVTRPGGTMRNAELTLNTTKAALQSGPSVAKNDWQKLDDQSFTQSIYSHYNLQPPSAMGGVGAGSMGGSSSGSGSSQNNNQVKPPRY